MILKSLRMNNIRSYSDEEIRFPEGSTLLSGDIGAGKSTILMAIEFALFGIMKAEFSGASLLRNGKNHGSVELNFTIDGKDISIKRVLKRQKEGVKQEAGSIIIDGIQSDLMPQELKSKIISLIGYPEDFLTSAKSLIFRYTVYTPQEEMKKIIFDDASERLNSLRKIFGVDKYKAIASNAEIAARKLGEEKRVLAERIIDLDEKIRQKSQLEYEIKAIKETLENAVLEVKKLQETLEEKRKNSSATEAKLNEFNKIKNEIKIICARISEKDSQKRKSEAEIALLSREIELLGKKANEMEILVSLEGLEQGIEEDEKNYLNKLSEKAVLKSKEEEILRKIKADEEESQQFERKISEISAKEAKLQGLKSKALPKTEIENEIKANLGLLTKLKEQIAGKEAWKMAAVELKDGISSMDRCPVCDQTIFDGQKADIRESQDKKLIELGQEINSLIAKKESSEQEQKLREERLRLILESEKEAKMIEGEVSTSRLVKESYSLRQRKIAEMKLQLESFLSKIKEMEGIEKIMEQIKKKKEMLKKAKEIDFAKKNLDEKIAARKKAETGMDELKKEISLLKESEVKLSAISSDFKDCEAEMASARKDVENAQESLKKSEMRKIGFEKDHENMQALINNLDAEIIKKTETKERIQMLSERQSWLRDRFIEFVKLVESHVMQNVYEEFDSNFKQWVSVLLEDSSINAMLDSNFTPKVQQNGFEMEIADLSGGEKTSFALAYRLALNKVVNDVLSAIKTKDLLILDEPTDGFSAEQLDRLRDVIEQIGIAQIIIVSHEAKLESFVQNIIRIDKSHDVSRVLA